MSKKTEQPGIEDIDCLEAIDNLYAYIDGEIDDPDTIAKFEHHLTHCRHCYSRTELERELTSRMKNSGRNAAPESLQHRLKNLIDKI